MMTGKERADLLFDALCNRRPVRLRDAARTPGGVGNDRAPRHIESPLFVNAGKLGKGDPIWFARLDDFASIITDSGTVDLRHARRRDNQEQGWW
jgi:hypothetical protein